MERGLGKLFGEHTHLIKIEQEKNPLSEVLKMDSMFGEKFLERKTNVMKSNWKPVRTALKRLSLGKTST